MTISQEIHIGDRALGTAHPVYIIAELSANHRQNFDEAVRIVRAAKQAGADAVKLQTYTPETITIRSDRECFRIGGGTVWDGRTLHDLYAEAYTPWEWQPKLKTIADEIGIDLFSSAFDPTAVDFLESIGVPVHKIASPELVDIPLIKKMAQTGKPLILSTGMATLEEIEEAVAAARDGGATQIALLRCTSAYPAPWSEMNLRSIPDLHSRFRLPVGFSDHSPGITASIAAAALGAALIEKHLTISRSAGGPDSLFSLEPDEFKALVDAVRTVEQSLGQVYYGPTPHERRTTPFRRSLFAVKAIKNGEVFTRENVRSIRPAAGLHPRCEPEVLGRTALCDIEAGTPLSWDLIAPLAKSARTKAG